jgi:PUA domain protein
MSAKHRRYFLKTKETKDLIDKASAKLKINLEQTRNDKTSIEIIQTENTQIYLLNGKPILAQTDNDLYPTLTFTEFIEKAPKITVDMGAIPHVCKGANVMAPGIRKITGEFQKGDIVIITDEKHNKPIALGETQQDTEQTRNMKQGIAIKNIHYVGDKTWNQIKQLTN